MKWFLASQTFLMALLITPGYGEETNSSDKDEEVMPDEGDTDSVDEPPPQFPRDDEVEHDLDDSAEDHKVLFNDNGAIITREVAARLLIIGDSLSSGYGLIQPHLQAYPFVAASDFSQDGYDQLTIINRSIEMTATNSGVQRLKQHIPTDKPSHVLLALGSNDVLYQKNKYTQRHIEEMVAYCLDNQVQPLLAAIDFPDIDPFPAFILAVALLTYKNYLQDFAVLRNIIHHVAYHQKIALWPNMLKGVAVRPRYNQPDFMHPNVYGHRIMADNFKHFLTRPRS